MRPFYTLVFTISLALISFTGWSQTQLTFRIANKQVISGTPNDSLEFEVQVKIDSAGKYHRNGQVYFRYNSDAFGANIISNGATSISPLNFAADKFGGSIDLYTISPLDGTGDSVIIFVNSAFAGQNGGSGFHSVIPTSWTSILRIAIEIDDPAVFPEIEFSRTSMDGQWSLQANGGSSAVAHKNPNLYEDELTVYPLEDYDIIWDGATWSGGTGTGNAPGSSDQALDMLIEVDTTDPMPGNASVNKLIILDGSVLDLGGNTLTITGELIGSIKGSAINGTIRFAGSVEQKLFGDTEWENITIDNSNGVTVVSGNQTITDVLTPTSGTFTTADLVTLKATSASSYGQIDAGSGGSISGNVTFQMYIDQAGWHNLCSPLASSTLDDLEDDIILNYKADSATSGASVLYWNNATGNFLSATDSSDSFNRGWNIYIDDNFIPAGGGVNGDSSLPVILDIFGSPTTGSVSTTLDYYSGAGNWSNYGGGPEDGWNLIYNPYPSNLDWTKVGPFVSGDVNDYFYIWDQSLNSGSGGYVGHNGSVSVNGAISYIAPMQAIWVKVESAGGASSTAFNFDNTDRTTSTSAELYKTIELLRLQMVRDSDNFRDEMVVVRQAGKSMNKDPQGDAPKFKHPSATSSNIYVITPDSAVLAVSAIDPSYLGDTVFIGVLGTAESHTISIDENSFPIDFKVELYDRKLNTTTDLLTQDYTFMHDPNFDEHRFDLIAVSKTIGIEEEETSGANSLNVRSRDGWVTIEFPRDLSGKATVEVIDMAGRVLYSEEDVDTMDEYVFSFHTSVKENAVYVVRVLDQDSDNFYAGKIIY